MQPIRNKRQVEEFLEALKEKDLKYYTLAFCGIYSGLRISDLLSLQVKDVRNARYLYIKEKKTEKKRTITINAELKKVLDIYIEGMDDDSYVFHQRLDKHKPVSRQYTHRILSETAAFIGINEKISNHSLRKTFGWFMYQQTKDVALLQQIFGHSAPSVTLRYIGVNDKIIETAYDNFSIL
ncbi:tyrosine-type recombinase/integrase [Peribacillus sp. AS_2]|uniref:tyrosine-type recombinase/integrase n=1 Tax=Peribacillus sp. AS_2 TaxID=2996755 RepID=UPI0022A6DE55|nr:tyrosine-type recombinase/integrase [Peribacillus sp. AS_2]MCZ0875626.1 tyrosine-type recombinase/integrase [Peribacillus sp. AS_2]